MTRDFGMTNIIDKSRKAVKRFTSDEGGATAIEYSLIVALIFLGILSALNAFSASNSAVYEKISSSLDTAAK